MRVTDEVNPHARAPARSRPRPRPPSLITHDSFTLWSRAGGIPKPEKPYLLCKTLAIRFPSQFCLRGGAAFKAFAVKTFFPMSNFFLLLLFLQEYVPTSFDKTQATLQVDGRKVDFVLWDTSGKRGGKTKVHVHSSAKSLGCVTRGRSRGQFTQTRKNLLADRCLCKATLLGQHSAKR